MKIDTEIYLTLKKAMAQAQAEADGYIGKELVWKDCRPVLGYQEKPYKGRACVVTQATYRPETGEILVLVKTRGTKPHTWLDDNDSFHRFYRTLDYFE